MLLRNLCSIGYLDFDRATRLYKPTIRILLLSSWMTRRFSETGQIASALDALYERTREVVILSIQNNARMQTILMRGADRAGTQFDVPNDDGERHIRIRSGLFASLTCSAMGRAVLSLKSNREIRSWTRRANAEADSPRLRIPEREMLEVTDIVRQKGYAETQGVFRPGLGALAIAMPSPMDTTPLAISVSMPVGRLASKHDLVLDALFAFRDQFTRAHRD